MDAVTALFGALKAGMSIWESKERTKYLDRLMSLEREYHVEKNKLVPDDAVLDDLEFSLFLLSSSFGSEVRKSAAQNLPG